MEEAQTIKRNKKFPNDKLLLSPELVRLSLHPLANFLKAFSSLFEEGVLIQGEGEVVL